MDPFSLATGIVGVIGVAIQITQIVLSFGSNWRNAPNDMQNLVSEIEAMRKTLSATQCLLVDSDFAKALIDGNSIKVPPREPTRAFVVSAIDACGPIIDPLKEGLENFVSELRQAERSDGTKLEALHRLWARFKTAIQFADLRANIEKFDRHCQQLDRHVTLFIAGLSKTTLNEVRDARAESQKWHEEAENRLILNWISSLDFEKTQADILHKLQQGTGQWLIQHEKFKSWRGGDSKYPRTLWCPGIPGAGKSVMTSAVIDYLQRSIHREPIYIAYIYCDYKDVQAQTTTNLLASLVKQVALKLPEIPTNIRAAYRSHSPPKELLLKEFVTILSGLLHERRSFVLVDGLDEHASHGSSEIINFIIALQNALPSSARLFLTGRTHLVDQYGFMSALKDHTCIDIQASDSDIRMYLLSRLADNARSELAMWAENDAAWKEQIIETLTKKARGMFLLPKLHMDALQDQISPEDVDEAMECLPTELDKTYEDVMHRINGQVKTHRDLAIMALTWITSARRPLHVDELRHALAAKSRNGFVSERSLPGAERIVSVSAGLLTVDPARGTIGLIHFTVEEYFRRLRTRWFLNAEEIITRTCVTYLCMKSLSTFCTSIELLEEKITSHPLLKYVCWNLATHISNWSFADGSVSCLECLETLQGSRGALQLLLYFRCNKVSQPTRLNCTIYSVDEISFVLSTLHIAALYELAEMCKLVSEEEGKTEVRDYDGNTPLHLAASIGAKNIIEILLPRTPSFDKANSRGYRPLHLAIHSGIEHIALFLKAGASAPKKDGDRIPPLCEAAELGHPKDVQMLLNYGANPAERDSLGRTPLMCAVNLNFQASSTIYVLVQNGARINDRDQKGNTVLHYFVESLSYFHMLDDIGIRSIIRSLVDHGADVMICNNEGSTAFDLLQAGVGTSWEMDLSHDEYFGSQSVFSLLDPQVPQRRYRGCIR